MGDRMLTARGVRSFTVKVFILVWLAVQVFVPALGVRARMEDRNGTIPGSWQMYSLPGPIEQR